MQNESSVELNEVEAEGLSAFTEAVDRTFALALVIGGGRLSVAGCVIAEHAVDDDG